MALSKRQRFGIFKRDRFTCQYCGRCPPAVVLEVDHVIPESAGGSSHASNLVASCFDCNRGKAHLPLDERPAAVVDEFARQRELQAQSKAFNKLLMDERKLRDKQVSELGIYWANQSRPPAEHGKWTVNEPSRRSLYRFLEGLTQAQIMDAMDIAWRKMPPGSTEPRVFTYFCGVCWTTIRGKQEGK